MSEGKKEVHDKAKEKLEWAQQHQSSEALSFTSAAAAAAAANR